MGGMGDTLAGIAGALLARGMDVYFVAYGDRAEHCWNGDHTRTNAYSRLRYHQMFIPRIMDQIRRNHPAGVDTLSWRY